MPDLQHIPKADSPYIYAYLSLQKSFNADINPLDKLSFIVKRGMGALEFLPEASMEQGPKKIDMASLADLARRIFSERELA